MEKIFSCETWTKELIKVSVLDLVKYCPFSSNAIYVDRQICIHAHMSMQFANRRVKVSAKREELLSKSKEDSFDYKLSHNTAK